MPSGIERSIGRLEGKVDGIVGDIKTISDSMNALKSSFDVLEKGRLSNLEVSFASLQAEVQVKAKNTALWAGAIISVSVSVVSGVLIYIITRKGI